MTTPRGDDATPAKPTKPAGSASSAELELYTTLRRRLVICTAAIAIIGIVAGLVASGTAGLWGALLAAGIGVAFMLTTVLLVGWVARRSPQLLLAAMLGSWLVKMVLAFVAVLVLRPLTFYDKNVFFFTLAAVVVGGLAVEAYTVMTSRAAIAIDERS